MVHLSDYSFKSKDEGIDRLKHRTVDLHTPLHLGGYFALFEPNKAPKKSNYYSFYWFATQNNKTAREAAYISPNNY